MKYPITSAEALGSALRSTRSGKKLTQTAVGKKVGIDQTTVSAVENGSPGTRLDTILHLLAALDLEMIIQPRGESSQPLKDGQW